MRPTKLADQSRFTGSPLPDFLGAFLVVALAVALLAAIDLRGGDISLALMDPATITGSPVYLGAVSNAGVVVLVVAASACFIASAAGTKDALLLKSVALFSGLMALDDLFLLHEGPIRNLLPWFEKLVFLIYASCAVVAFVLIGKRLLHLRQLPIVLGVFCMAISVVIDLLPLSFASRVLVEDLSKFSGFIVWGTYWSRISLDVVRSLRIST